MSEQSTLAATLVAWLERRAEPAPPSLRPRLAKAIESTSGASASSLVELSSRAGERLLAGLLERGCGERSAAPDLLAADALMTYAFEAAAEDDAQSARAIDGSAARAITRVAGLGAKA